MVSNKNNEFRYQAIGWVYNAVWVPNKKITETKILLPDTGQEFHAVWSNSIHYKFSKNPKVKKRVDSGEPVNLLVYPYTRKDGDLAKFLIAGMYLPSTKPEIELESVFGDLEIEEGTTALFKIRGRLVDVDPGKIGIRIKRNGNPRVKRLGKTQEWKGFKLTILGELDKKDTVPGDYWELLCELVEDKIVLVYSSFIKERTGGLFGNPTKRTRYKYPHRNRVLLSRGSKNNSEASGNKKEVSKPILKKDKPKKDAKKPVKKEVKEPADNLSTPKAKKLINKVQVM